MVATPETSSDDESQHEDSDPTGKTDPADSGVEKEENESKPQKKEYKGKKLIRAQQKKGKSDAEEAGEAGEAGESGEAPELIIKREFPMEVLYCPVCTFPAEMCEFSGMMEKCRPWLQEHASELANAEEKGRKRRILTEKARLEALVEGHFSRKHVVTRSVLVELDDRDRRRQLTIVTGMDLFGFNLKDLSREWRKRFSAGGGVREGEEKHEQSRIEIQGNVVSQLGELLLTKYSVPKECIFRIVKNGSKKEKINFFD